MISQIRHALVCLLDARRALNIATASDRGEAILAKCALLHTEEAIEVVRLADQMLLVDERRPRDPLPIAGGME